MIKCNKILKILLSVLLALAIAAASFAAGFFTHKYTANEEVSSYRWLLDIIQKNYYYGDVGSEFTETAADAIVAKYLDKYSAYYTAEEYAVLQASNAGSKSGLGLTYSFISGKGVFVHSVVGNSPAYKSGLRAGEWLVGGSNTAGDTVTFESSSDFANLINSAADGEDMTFVSSDGEVYTLAKSAYTASYVYMCTNYSAWIYSDAAEGGLAIYEEPSEAISYLPDGAAYINLSQFYGTAALEFYKLIEKFNAQECDTLILDLRSNGGGYVSVMQSIAGVFSGGSAKVAMISRDKYGNEDKFNCTRIDYAPYRVPSDTRIYVLANSGTASASEALIGAMICYGVLDYENIFLSDYSSEYLEWLYKTGQGVMTARTYGKGIMQTTYENERTGEALKLTTAQIFWPDGVTSIHDTGITVQDGCTPVYAEWVHTKCDDELRSAVEIIKTR